LRWWVATKSCASRIRTTSSREAWSAWQRECFQTERIQPFKQIFRELLRIINPRLQRPVKLSGVAIENRIVLAVLAYVFVYVSCIILATLLLAATGLDALTAFSAAVASINNTGPGLGQVGPMSNYAVLGDFQVWVCSFLMLLGRLELMTLLVVMTPAFWRK